MVRDHLRLRRKAAIALWFVGVLVAAWLLAAGAARAEFSYVGSIGGVTQDEFFFSASSPRPAWRRASGRPTTPPGWPCQFLCPHPGG